MKIAKAEARRYLLEDNPNYKYCEKVYIIDENNNVVRVYDQWHHGGRLPYLFEAIGSLD